MRYAAKFLPLDQSCSLAKLLWEPWSSGYGDNSCSKGHGFESQCHILDGHFSH